LTGPRTAGQSRIVMAALLSDAMLSSRTNATNETRKVGKQSGGDSAGAVSGGDSVEVRVTYMNAVSRKNLTDACAWLVRTTRAPRDTSAAFGGVTGIAPSRRMTTTCTWGVSDPCGPGVGRRRGQPNGGRSRPTGRSALMRQRRRLKTGGTEHRRVAAAQFAD
jgi:hypothetical protein